MNFDAVCLSVGQHQSDIAMAGLTVTESREAYVTFSDSYYSASQRLITMADDTTFDNCKTAEDVEAILNQLSSTDIIGCQSGTTAQYYIQGDLDDPEGFGFAGLPATAKGYDNGSLAVQDMMNGNIKYVIIDAAPAAAIAEAMNANA